MSRKIFTTLSIFALLFAVTVTAYAQNNGNGNGNTGNGQNKNGFVTDVQEKTEAGNNGFDQRQDVTVKVTTPRTLFVGMTDCWIEVTLHNISGRAIPDVTVWSNEVPVELGRDSLGKPFYSYSLSDDETKTFRIAVDTSEAGTIEYAIDVWTRLGNKNWQDLFYGAEAGNGPIKIEIIEQSPEYPDGIGTDDEGNLIVDVALLGIVMPQSNGQGWIEITVGDAVLRDSGQGGAQFNTSKKTIKIQRSALATGVVSIYVETYNPNDEAFLEFELYLDENGFPIGAVLL